MIRDWSNYRIIYRADIVSSGKLREPDGSSQNERDNEEREEQEVIC